LFPALKKFGSAEMATTRRANISPSAPLPPPKDLDVLARELAQMYPSDRLKAVEAELGARNHSGINVKWHSENNGQITGLHLTLARNDNFDIAPLRLLTGLKPLRIDSVHSEGPPVFEVTIANFAELWALRLEEFHCSQIQIQHLAPLKGMPLTDVRCDYCGIESLEPLRGMKLKSLNASNNLIRDLGPLEKMPLERLDVSSTLIQDLTPLKGMPLIELKCNNTRIESLEPLDGNITLAVLSCPPLNDTDKAILRRLPALKIVNGRPAPERAGTRKIGEGKRPAGWRSLRDSIGVASCVA